jgi:hypothetical protein
LENPPPAAHKGQKTAAEGKDAMFSREALHRKEQNKRTSNQSFCISTIELPDKAGGDDP